MNTKPNDNELEPEEMACPDCEAEQTTETPVEEDQTEQVEETVEEHPVFAEAKEMATSKNKPVIIAAIIAAVVILAIAAFVIGQNKKEVPVEFSAETTLTVLDEGGVFLPHDFQVADDLFTEEVAAAIVASCGEMELDNETLAYYFYQNYMNFFSQYGSYATMFLDVTAPLSEQMFSETQTFQDYFIEMAITTYQQEAALYQCALAEGYTLSADYQAYYDSFMTSMNEDVKTQGFVDANDYLTQFYGPQADEESFQAYILSSMTAMDFISTKVADLTFTEDEVLAYYEAKAEEYATYGVTQDGILVDVRHVLVTPELDENASSDESGNVIYSEESWALAKSQAELLLADWEAGEATEASFADMATEYTADPGSASTGGLYEGVATGQMVDTFDAWCFDESRQPGDYGMVETTYGYHLMYFVGSNPDNSWYTTAEADLLYDTQVEIQDSYVTQYEFGVNYDNVALPVSRLEDELAATYGY